MKRTFGDFGMDVLSDNTIGSSSDKPVQERLLDAAEGLFCEHGFEGTSVRDIAAAAGCNIASVNYYFGGKEKLYLEVWRRHFNLMRQARIASIDRVMSKQGGEPSLEELLASYADAFVEPLVDKHTGGRFIKLMAREMVDRHLPQNIFLEEMIIPVMTALQQALIKICPGLSEVNARLAILSVVGQLVHTICAETMLEQSNYPEMPKFELAEVIRHIVKFSAAGIRACAEQKEDRVQKTEG
jgi:AcrR family transcriptional regulator